MTREEIKNGIVEILQTIASIDEEKLNNITEETDFLKDLEAPSAELVNVIAKAENLFDIEFDDDDVDEMGTTVGEVIDLILKTIERKDNENS